MHKCKMFTSISRGLLHRRSGKALWRSLSFSQSPDPLSSSRSNHSDHSASKKPHKQTHRLKSCRRCPTDRLCVDICLIYIFNLPVLHFCLSKPIYAGIIAVRPPCFAVCIARSTGNSACFCCIAFKSN